MIRSLDSENIGILVKLRDNVKASRIRSVLDGKVQGDWTLFTVIDDKL